MPTHKNDLRFSAFKMDVDKKWKKEIFLSQYKYFNLSMFQEEQSQLIDIQRQFFQNKNR